MKRYRLLQNCGATVLASFFLPALVFSGCGRETEPALPEQPTIPPAPTSVSAVPGDGQVTISWAAVSGATSYNLYMATQSGVTKANYATKPGGAKHAGVTSPSTRTGLTNGTTYYFVVTAVSAAGESAESAEVSATPSLSSDFAPCSGSGGTAGINNRRLLLAASDDGLTWTKTFVKLADRSSVPDGVVLPSGRVLVYYVTACRNVRGTQQTGDIIVVAVSDDNGTSWAYKNVTINNAAPPPATRPVDPNVVVLPNGSIRMFYTVDPDGPGPSMPETRSAVSTDGGFAFTQEAGTRVAINNELVLDPEWYRFSDTDYKCWPGGNLNGSRLAVSTDGNTFTVTQNPFPTIVDNPGPPTTYYIVADVAAVAGGYRMYVFSNRPGGGIKSMSSTDGASWTADAGFRLVLETGNGLEAGGLTSPGVVRLRNGKYLMVYETDIPL